MHGKMKFNESIVSSSRYTKTDRQKDTISFSNGSSLSSQQTPEVLIEFKSSSMRR